MKVKFIGKGSCRIHNVDFFEGDVKEVSAGLDFGKEFEILDKPEKKAESKPAKKKTTKKSSIEE